MPTLTPRKSDPEAFDVFADDGRRLGWVSRSSSPRDRSRPWLVSGDLWSGTAATPESGAAALAEVERARVAWTNSPERAALTARFGREADWSAVHHAYGPAGDLPDVLADLFCPDDRLRLSALSNLYGRICHQGTVYVASAVAAPVLARLVLDEATPRRDPLFPLLAYLATGFAPGSFHATEDKRRDAERVRRDVREAVRVQLGLLLRAGAPDRRYVLSQAVLASAFPDEPAITEPYFAKTRAVLDSDRDLAVIEAARSPSTLPDTGAPDVEPVTELLAEALGEEC